MAIPFQGVLDCTFRDGGYYTNWDFSDEILAVYLDAMAANRTVFGVELGYRSPAKGEYHGKYFHLPYRLLLRAKEQLRADQKLVVMLNEKDSQPEKMPELLGDLAGVVDMIRFATPPNATASALALTKACVELGFEVGLNIMYMHKYIDDVDVLAPLADAPASSIALVDSYGSCTPVQVKQAVERATHLFTQPLGFHGHDNISLAFANSVAALEGGAASLDATVQGMGRGAGNLKTELMIAYLALSLGKEAEFGSLAKAVAEFGKLQKEFEWGSNLAYMISGFAGLPQADVMDWFGTRRYSLGSIVSALRQKGRGESDERGFPNMASAPALNALRKRPAIVIGGGSSVLQHFDAIADMARTRRAVVVHSTTRHAEPFAKLDVPQVYCLAGEEINRLAVGQREAIFVGEERFIAVQPAPRLPGTVPEFPNCYEVMSALSQPTHLGPIADEAPLEMALSAAAALGAPQVWLAGFDGYRDASIADQKNAQDVQAAINAARGKGVELTAITPTMYSVPQLSVYAATQGINRL